MAHRSARWSVFLALASCLGTPAAAQTPGPAQFVKVMTFNIRYGTARDGTNHWTLRAHRVLDRIKAHRPDIFGLQEAMPFQVQQLEQALPHYVSFGTYRDAARQDESCRVFVRASRFAIEDSGTFWLSPTPDKRASKGWDAALPRVCTWAVLRDKILHGRFLFANAHLDHRGKQARFESAKLIAAWAKIFQLPVVLVGDFNSDEGTLAMRHLRANGFRDSFRVVHPDVKEVGTSTGFRRRSRKKIDYVFVTEEVKVRAAKIDTTLVDNKLPSDHFPVTATIQLPAGEAPKLMPVLASKPWHLGDNPDLGTLTGTKQEVVDHAIFRSDDGAWHLWACIRGTKIGRVLYKWEGRALTQPHWKRGGIAMRADPRFGESIDDWGGKEWIQAPHVLRFRGLHHMLYGGHRSELEHCQICLATSKDGRTFQRAKNAFGQSRVFVGPGEARDPMMLWAKGKLHCYYTGNPDPRKRKDKAAVYCRTTKDLKTWSKPRRVCFGGSAGDGMWSAECPHVVRREGYYYLFRTTSYRKPLTHVYRSTDPMDFGLGDDDKKIGTIAVAAPEIVTSLGRDYISSVHDLKGGVQLMRLDWK